MTRTLLNLLSLAICLTAIAASATAQRPTVPFVEDFENGIVGWRGNATFDASGVAIDPTGGVDGSALLTTEYAFDAPSSVVFRAQVATSSSGDAFTGSYNAGGPKQFSFNVTHDAPIPLGIGIRFTTPINFPGAFVIGFDPVAPNQLTELSVDVNPGNIFAPNVGLFGDIAFFEGGPPLSPAAALASYNQIFDNVGAVQITTSLPSNTTVIDQDLLNIASGNPSINLPAGAAIGDVFDNFTVVQGVVLLDEFGDEVLDDLGDQILIDIEVPGLTSTPVFNTADSFTFGLDNVTLVPEPGSALLVLMLGVGVCSRGRRV